MVVSYDRICQDFLRKITEYTFLSLPQSARDETICGYIRSSVMRFSTTCAEPVQAIDDDSKTVTMENDINEIEFVDIISDGMVFYWFNQYMYAAENLKNQLNTVDFSSYSPAELLKQVKAAFEQCKTNYVARLRQYTYDHGNLGECHN